MSCGNWLHRRVWQWSISITKSGLSDKGLKLKKKEKRKLFFSFAKSKIVGKNITKTIIHIYKLSIN